ncbi:Toll/interleukin-1 receptor homology (TIR) domain-containing protein [Hirschfeldia incana]|nr:Toll/interleukin-1 receptor homology (TIR) domain-containing protein [Hirschfeldia incana]
MVIPIFYHVDPSEVRKQTGEFGERFKETCKDKTEDDRERWIQALTDVANLAGEDSKNWIGEGEAKMIQHIAKDVLNKLMIPSNHFSDFVGIEAHLERLNSLLCLESDQEVRKVGIWGPSGIGKSTIGRALFSQLSSLFHHHAFVSYKSTEEWGDNSAMKLCLDERLLSEIFQKEVKIRHLGEAKQRLMHKKIIIIVDDVDDVEALNTLMDQTSLVGSGSRIVVITQDKKLLKSQGIELIYEVELPSCNLAMQMFCRSAFGKNSPPYGFEELAEEVALHSSNLPLGLCVLGSSLKGMNKEEWVGMLPRLVNSLNRKIKKTLKVCYDRLDVEDQELFLYIACLSDGHNVNFLKDLLEDSAKLGLKILNDKSLIRWESTEIVRTHSLLQKLGKEINLSDPINNRRFLTEADDICDVLTDNTGTENTLAMYLNMSEIKETLFIHKKSFKGMRNLKLLKFYKSLWPKETGKGRLSLPDRGLDHFPPKLRFLRWDEYPSKCMPSRFRVESLVELRMEYSKVEKLWEGTQFLGSLKEMDMSYSADLKEIPDLSKAINIKELKLWGCSSLVALHSSIGNLSKMYGLRLSGCTSLVTLPSSIGNLSKLFELDMSKCSNLNYLPDDVDLESLGVLNLNGCSKLRTFPRISRNITSLYLEETALEGEEDSSWIENIAHLKELYWNDVPLSCMPTNFKPEDLEYLVMSSSRLKKLWGGVKSLRKLWGMHLSGCESLVEIPDLSMAIALRYLELINCKSLVVLHSSIRNLFYLKRLNMEGCTMLEVLPVDINLVTLKELYLGGCSKLKNFPQISTSIVLLYLDDTAIEEIPSWIKNMSRLKKLTMCRCKNLKNISAEIFKLECDKADFSDCGGITKIRDHLPGPHNDVFDISSYISFRFPQVAPFKFYNCFNLDRDAQEIIIQSYPNVAVIPGGEVPIYFTHRACGSSLSILLSESALSQESILLKTCIVVGPSRHYPARLTVRQYFRGQKEEIPCDVIEDTCTYEQDHLVLFILHLQIKREDNSPSEPNNNVLLLEFYKSHYDGYYEGCSCGSSFGSHKQNSTLEEIKGCGARVMNISKTDFRESDEESNRSKKKMRV